MAFGIYLHWPFCASKCPYCDFNSHVAERIDHAKWLDAYRRELRYYAALTQGRVVDTIFFGGGTPSLMRPETVAGVIAEIRSLWPVSDTAEITLEANPTSFEISKFEAFRAGGINRVSIGVQSLYADELDFLGRAHTPDQAVFAIDEASRIFDRVTFDLIYARPKQTLVQWERELSEALRMARGHLSLYQLTIERGTPFFTRHSRGEFVVPEQDLAADFYDLTQSVMEAHGLPAYEVSNHARAGDESRHNLIYWRYEDYLGIGPGAHGRLTLDGQKLALRDHRAPDIWLARVDELGHGGAASDVVEPLSKFQECLMMGLRLREGVPLARLSEAAGADVWSVLDRKAVDTLVSAQMVVCDDKTLRATPQGLKCLNAVLGYLVGG